jgi:hypothetical protein
VTRADWPRRTAGRPPHPRSHPAIRRPTPRHLLRSSRSWPGPARRPAIEADAAALRVSLLRAGQGGRAVGTPSGRCPVSRPPRATRSCRLMSSPERLHRLGREVAGLPEHVGMAPHQSLGDGGRHVPEREAPASSAMRA